MVGIKSMLDSGRGERVHPVWTLLDSRIRVGELEIAERAAEKLEGDMKQLELLRAM